MTGPQILLEIFGDCPICEAPARFVAKTAWLRGALYCQSCKNGSTPRERALAAVLTRECPDWRSRAIHECSPMNRGISLKLREEAAGYVGTHFYPDRPPGSIVDGWRNENIQQSTFADGTFDLVVTMDVTEHVFDPAAMFRDIHRTLKSGGLYLSTFPIRKVQVDAAKPLARRIEDGSIELLKEPPEYHGNPIDNAGSLVTWDYGYDIHAMIAEWAPFGVEISRFADRHIGVLGEYTEVIICRKR